MRVLIVNPGIFAYGGAELLIVRLANYMTKRGIENAFLTTTIPPVMEKDLDRTRILIQKVPNIPLGEIRELLALHRGVKNNLDNFDVINVHNYPAELSVYPYDKPVVWMCNEPFLYLMSFESSLTLKLRTKIKLIFDKYVVRNYIKNVVVADGFNAERFRKIYGFNPEIINYGIDYEFFSCGGRMGLSDRFDLDNSFSVLQVGMLQPFKNQMESIRTIEKLKERIPNIKLILAGWGLPAYEELLKKYVREKGLEKNVIFTGHLNKESVRDLYHACDVLLHPIKPQGGWLSPFEALCAGLPIVVSKEMTASDIIRKENIGVVTDNYVEAILEVYNNPEKYKKTAEKGKEWVIKHLSWEKYCEKMVNLFTKVYQERNKE